MKSLSQENNLSVSIIIDASACRYICNEQTNLNIFENYFIADNQTLKVMFCARLLVQANCNCIQIIRTDASMDNYRE